MGQVTLLEAGGFGEPDGVASFFSECFSDLAGEHVLEVGGGEHGLLGMTVRLGPPRGLRCLAEQVGVFEPVAGCHTRGDASRA